MSVLKLRQLHEEIKGAVRFANVHMDIAMPQWLKNHANVNTQTLSRLRDTDANASRLAEFRHSIKHNRAEDGSENTGTDDYASMVDTLISKSGLIKPYAGPSDFRDFAQLKDLAGQLKKVASTPTLENASEAWNNKGFQAMKSVATLAFTQAVTEVESTIGTEVTPAIRDAIIEGIVTEYNGVTVEFNGETITVDDMKAYIKDARS